MRKIVYVTGTRADYGLMKETLDYIDCDEDLQLDVIATGMHLMNNHGNSLDEITNKNVHIVDEIIENDSYEAMGIFVGNLTSKLTKKISEINPDIVLLLGDRGEMLAAAIAASYLQIPIAHIHGGDISSTVDDVVRHVITKLSSIHFPATKKSASRIKQMGESEDYIFISGAPGLDSIAKIKYDENEILKKYNVQKPFALVLQHPVSLEVAESGKQMKETLDALIQTDLDVIVIYPNSDAGSSAMMKEINKTSFNSYKNIPHDDFIALLDLCEVLVGNSSSGIIESGLFNLPVVNIGSRQDGREAGGNVINCDYESREILDAINLAISNEFKEKIKDSQNPYGNGEAYKIITETLKDIKLEKQLLNKEFIELIPNK